MADTEVIIVGGGLAGINCARVLEEHGKDYLLIEGSNALGGRVKTDKYKGFLLDHGFQVFLSAYPEARQVLDYDTLDLHCFKPGSVIRIDDKFETITDPANQPMQALGSLFSPIGSISDKFKLASLRNRVMSKSPDDIFREVNNLTTLEYLKQKGFSEKIIDRLFRPFLGGIFLNRDLQTSARMLEFVFRMFSEGETCLPAKGMQSIPESLSNMLPKEKLKLNTKVDYSEGNKVFLSNGETISAKAVVIATEAPEAARILGIEGLDLSSIGNACLYFSAPKPPVKEPMLVLNGNDDGPVNSLAVLSNVAPTYAPKGKHLISISVIDQDRVYDPGLTESVSEQLKSWFPKTEVDQWEHLRNYIISYALPRKHPQHFLKDTRQLGLEKHQFICGDHLFTASVNGALASGRQTGERILKYLTKA